MQGCSTRPTCIIQWLDTFPVIPETGRHHELSLVLSFRCISNDRIAEGSFGLHKQYDARFALLIVVGRISNIFESFL